MMTEEDARSFIEHRWGAPAVHRLENLVGAVVQENLRQNLIAAATLPVIWSRHVVDSAQLLSFGGNDAVPWVDVGTGAGFPGMVVAALRTGAVTLIEPRARRVEFLRNVASQLGLTHVHVLQGKAESVKIASPAAVVSARAVATIGALFEMSQAFTNSSTTFILPRGRSGAEEVETLSARWHGMFHVKQSLTDREATILVATGVRRRCSASR